jgi:hypothetical protein
LAPSRSWMSAPRRCSGTAPGGPAEFPFSGAYHQ